MLGSLGSPGVATMRCWQIAPGRRDWEGCPGDPAGHAILGGDARCNQWPGAKNGRARWARGISHYLSVIRSVLKILGTQSVSPKTSSIQWSRSLNDWTKTGVVFRCGVDILNQSSLNNEVCWSHVSSRSGLHWRIVRVHPNQTIISTSMWISRFQSWPHLTCLRLFRLHLRL